MNNDDRTGRHEVTTKPTTNPVNAGFDRPGVLPVRSFLPNKKIIEEEQPTMRSVAIGPAPWQELPPPMPLGLPRPPKIMERSPKADNHKMMMNLPSPNITLETITPSPPLNITPSNWKVPSSFLSYFPSHQILSLTSRFICCDNPTLISTRIASCLRTRSIEASYDNDRAKAKCRNRDYVKFRIRLYRGRGEQAHGIIVELQRRSGSGVSFMKDCRAILDAAEGDDGDDVAEEEEAMRRLVVPESIVSGDNGVREEDVAVFIATASDLLRKENLDAKILGLQMIVSATDESRDTSPKVTRALLENLSVDTSPIFQIISSILTSGSHTNDKDDNSNDSNKQDDACDLTEQLHCLSLLFISHSLHLAHQNAMLENMLHQRPWFTETLVPLLIDTIKRATSRPRDAVAAIKALRSLVAASDKARMMARSNDAWEVLSMACDVGKKRMGDLERESERCRLTLECR